MSKETFTQRENKPTREAFSMRGIHIEAPAREIFMSMREKIREVFPDNDKESWHWTGEDFEEHEIERPENDFKRWLEKKFQKSDEFSKLLVSRMFRIWGEMEKKGFKANDLELYEHQKALFAWIAISTVTGVRDQIANLLVRSPYGSGKSLVAGLVVRAFKEVQDELIAEGVDPKELPTGVLLGLRKEHMLQNALGEQYAALQPPYTIERGDVRVYWKQMSTMFGADFTQHFRTPRGIKDPFYGLFALTEDEENLEPASSRLAAYIRGMDAGVRKSWMKIPKAQSRRIVETLRALMEGQIVLVPDSYNVPQPEKALPRDNTRTTGSKRYRGDSAHALSEDVKATHRHLALNPETYTTQPNMEHPARFCIAYGSMTMRDPDNVRIDVRQEILTRGVMEVIDEAGSFTPGTLGDTMSQLSGRWPILVGFTAQDQGIEGWTRSPQISIREMVRLELMKPIGFQGIGDPENPAIEGSEESWKEYEQMMFRDEKTATTLKLPQPHELDTVVVAPNVREYAHRIIKAHEKEKRPVKVWCFDPDAGENAWSIIANGFNAPKKEGDPKRILVAPPNRMSAALHLRAECYDILAKMKFAAIDQARGRLGHIRNHEGTTMDREKARTYFRTQWLQGASGEAYIREVARMMHYTVEDEGATWIALHCMIDADAYKRDEGRTNLSDPEPIPDSKDIRNRKMRMKSKRTNTPLKLTSAYVIERECKKAERKAARELKQQLSLPPKQRTPVAANTVPYRADNGHRGITIHTAADGMPINLVQLSEEFSVGSYAASVQRKVVDEHKKGVRGKKLAEVTLNELLRLLDVKANREHQAATLNGSEARTHSYSLSR